MPKNKILEGEKRTMKRVCLLGLVMLIVFALVACTSSNQNTTSEPTKETTEAPAATKETAVSEAPEKQYTFAYLSPNHGNPFWQMVAQGVQTEAEKSGVKTIIYDAQDDPAKQVSQAEDAILKEVDAILVSPFETDIGTAIVEKCVPAGVPVFVLDNGAEGDYNAFIFSDNKQGGRAAAEYIAENLPENPVIFEMQGLIGRKIPAQRGVGFNEVMNEKNLTVEYVQPADFNRDKGFTVMEDLLTKDPNINVVFCWNDEMALGALEAVAARNLTDKVMIVGFDATVEACQAVLDGKLSATVAQQPIQFGVRGVQLALKHLGGEPVEKINEMIECILVTKDNAADYVK